MDGCTCCTGRSVGRRIQRSTCRSRTRSPCSALWCSHHTTARLRAPYPPDPSSRVSLAGDLVWRIPPDGIAYNDLTVVQYPSSVAEPSYGARRWPSYPSVSRRGRSCFRHRWLVVAFDSAAKESPSAPFVIFDARRLGTMAQDEPSCRCKGQTRNFAICALATEPSELVVPLERRCRCTGAADTAPPEQRPLPQLATVTPARTWSTALRVSSSLSGQRWPYVSSVSMADWWPRRRWTALTEHPRPMSKEA